MRGEVNDKLSIVVKLALLYSICPALRENRE